MAGAMHFAAFFYSFSEIKHLLALPHPQICQSHSPRLHRLFLDKGWRSLPWACCENEYRPGCWGSHVTKPLTVWVFYGSSKLSKTSTKMKYPPTGKHKSKHPSSFMRYRGPLHRKCYLWKIFARSLWQMHKPACVGYQQQINLLSIVKIKLQTEEHC